MKNSFACALTASVLLYSALSVSLAANANEVLMQPPSADAGGVGQVVGGTRQETVAWPATLKFFQTVNSRSFACTATIIGPRVVLTAAHCISHEAIAKIQLPTGEALITCHHHPYYDGVLGADLALCLAAADIPTNALHERIDLNVASVRRNTNLFLLGYGCRKEVDSTTSGILYGGISPVRDMPLEDFDHYRTFGGVSICPGDSGGAAYSLTDESLPTGRRSIIGVNSGYLAGQSTSYLTPLSRPLLATFIRDWAARNGVAICGVTPGTANCRF